MIFHGKILHSNILKCTAGRLISANGIKFAKRTQMICMTFSHSISRLECFTAFTLPIFFLFSCAKKDPVLPQPAPDSIAAVQDTVVKMEPELPVVNYTAFIFPAKKKDSAMKVFNEKYSVRERQIILALNRLDSQNKWRADTLAIPDTFDESLMMYAPFPQTVHLLKDVHKIALFSYPVQAFALYENGNLLKWGPTSLGKKSAQTKRGLMFTNWKKELAISTVDSEWKLPYNFNIHNTLGIGWHQYELPGYPASHSCLRLLEDDAKYLYTWADQWTLSNSGQHIKAKGTPVIVYGDYAWGERKPWKKLPEDGNATDISLADLEEIVTPYLGEILREQKKTDQVKSLKSSAKLSS